MKIKQRETRDGFFKKQIQVKETKRIKKVVKGRHKNRNGDESKNGKKAIRINYTSFTAPKSNKRFEQKATKLLRIWNRRKELDSEISLRRLNLETFS